MPPLEPRDDRAADRDQGARRYRKNEPDGSISYLLAECHDALEHIADCAACRNTLAELLLHSWIAEGAVIIFP